MNRRPLGVQMLWNRPLPWLILAACTACASAPARGSCALAPADSAYLAAGPVYPECAVDQRARRLTRDVRPDFRPSDPPPGGTACYTAEIEFVVSVTGSPEVETARVVRTSNPRFADAVLATLPRWRYQPARIRGTAVRQVVREKQSMAVQVVVVRAGDIPRPGRPPLC
ncbi:MAG: energy transducer TonB [Gammaproteobacteria bacterium]